VNVDLRFIVFSFWLCWRVYSRH